MYMIYIINSVRNSYGIFSQRNATSSVVLDPGYSPIFPSSEDRSVSPPTVAEMFLDSTGFPFHSAYPFHPVAPSLSPQAVTVEWPSVISATIQDIQHWQ